MNSVSGGEIAILHTLGPAAPTGTSVLRVYLLRSTAHRGSISLALLGGAGAGGIETVLGLPLVGAFGQLFAHWGQCWTCWS